MVLITSKDRADREQDKFRDADNNTTAVAVVNPDGSNISGGGGGSGTQYTEGDVDTTITGTAIMFEGTSNTLKVVNSTDKLPVATGLNQPTTPSDTQPISAASLPLPSGASTSAKQDTIIGHVDGIEGLLTTIDADTGSLAGTVSGTEIQVDVLTMPTVAVTQSGTWDEVGINDSGNSITVDGSVTATPSTTTTIYNGQKNVTTAGTQVALATSQSVKWVVLKAKVTNTGNIFVGDASVDSSTGYILTPGEAISLDIANLATVYIDSAQNGEGVSYIAAA